MHSSVNGDLSITHCMVIGNLLQCLSCASLSHYPVKCTVAFMDSFIYTGLPESQGTQVTQLCQDELVISLSNLQS